MFTSKTLLITGGTGSFGNAVLKRFLHTEIKEIRVFRRDEKKQEDMRIELKNDKVKFYIGGVPAQRIGSRFDNAEQIELHDEMLTRPAQCGRYCDGKVE